MRDILTEKEMNQLIEVGFTKADGKPIHTLSELMEALPDELVIFTRSLKYRWELYVPYETSVKPVYRACLEIHKDPYGWEVSYPPANIINPELNLGYYRDDELIVALLNIAIALSTPSDQIEKRRLDHLPENEEDYQQMLERIENEN